MLLEPVLHVDIMSHALRGMTFTQKQRSQPLVDLLILLDSSPINVLLVLMRTFVSHDIGECRVLVAIPADHIMLGRLLLFFCVTLGRELLRM